MGGCGDHCSTSLCGRSSASCDLCGTTAVHLSGTIVPDDLCSTIVPYAAAVRHANHLFHGRLSRGYCSEDFTHEDDHQARYNHGSGKDDDKDDEEEEGMLLSKRSTPD